MKRSIFTQSNHVRSDIWILLLYSNTALDNDTVVEFRFKHKPVLLLVGSVKRAVFLIHPIAFSCQGHASKRVTWLDGRVG